MTQRIGEVELVGEGAVTSGGEVRGTGAGTVLTGLIGIDIQSSRSPEMHMREAAAQGIALRYELFDLAGAGHASADLATTLDAVERAGFAGVNITHPFKQSVIALLDRLSDEARAIGAVNAVVFGADGRVGYNTDSSGFAEGFERQLAGANVARVVQIGAGGAGAATATAMVNLGCNELVVIDSQADRAEDLVSRLPGTIARVGHDLSAELAAASGLINATPIGMEGYPGTPVDTALLRRALWVADVVYFPLETELLRAARAIGCRTAHGGDMAVFQAARAFDLFTGHRADRERMAANF
jgi:shikimate dehydrogenase